jgi:hypothetical protein
MTETASALSSWESFYVIVGSSGGALIGLQFVVITLIADRRPRITTVGSVAAFGTPTVVHLAAALLASAIMSAPWPSLGTVSIALTMCGLGGIAYGALVVRRARRQTEYEPVWEDWLWHAVLPCVSYAALIVGAALLRIHPQRALFIIAAAALGLLFIGIHNAWDSVIHLVASKTEDDTTKMA